VNDLSEKSGVHVRFLFGPAGTGKTFRCLEEIRTELKRDPAGAPLLFLAPKQATFQIERQLLADDSLPGYTRLQILSFERLADFLLMALDRPQPRLLDSDGRVMVLRALLTKHHGRLQLFRASARLPGFAQQLSTLLRELQRARITPAALEKAASEEATPLTRKLRDVALLFREYLTWLDKEKIEDADRLLDLATVALEETARARGADARFGGLWLDGFAEMTEQELALLRALLPWCARATLAFCCEADALAGRADFSPWSVIAQTARRCLSAVATVMPDIAPESLTRDRAKGRFADSLELVHLEAHWAAPVPFSDGLQDGQDLIQKPNGVRVIRAATPEEEVTFAAREILRHARAGGRFRETAVLVRLLEPYQDILRRVFTRYDIPHFIDRREPITHHPLAELTRHAVRVIALGWKQDDWFGLLKSGLAGAPELEIDWLENEALARGWEGRMWLEPIRIDDDPALAERLETVRQRVVPTLRTLHAALAGANSGYKPTGIELAAALHDLWRSFRVSDQLEAWARESSGRAAHATVWDQMERWRQTLALGFGNQPVSLREWLPVIEAGLASLTVGVIPPVLDEVLVGSIDRSRNPDLQLAFILGVNEGVFPAPPADPVLLTEAERAQLEGSLRLGAGVRQQLAHERFYGYIACTRARRKLFVTFSDADRLGRKHNPSVFITHLQRLFPNLVVESAALDNGEILHTSELIAPLLHAHAAGDAAATGLLARPVFDSVRRLAEIVRAPSRLAPETVARLYPQRFATSVSRLEEFAACRFRFFVTVGLRAKERLRYEMDARHTGTFQHEVLKGFHETVLERCGSWRKIEALAARRLVREIAERMRPEFKNGVLVATERDRVESANLITALEDFIETIVGWMQQYQFEPRAVELSFGKDSGLPAWELALDGGRTLAFTGTIDRVDLLVDPATRTARMVVMDYKSSARVVDVRLLAGGVQLQLFAYLAALRGLPAAAAHFGVERLEPAGAFYVSLRGVYKFADRRDKVLEDVADARRAAYKHRGRFIAEWLPQFDSAEPARGRGDQFGFRLKKDGKLHAKSTDPVPSPVFHALLGGVEQQLVGMGNAIFAGDISVNPYRHANKTPCDYCDYAPVCRIDRWTHEFRTLPAPPTLPEA
jgi:ATP-dependent helicase/nuclease subunit B